jgi:formylglycine-generating enzyme required for sulfatase activity
MTYSFSEEFIKINAFEGDIKIKPSKFNFEKKEIKLKTKPFLIQKYEVTNKELCKYFKNKKNSKLLEDYCQKDIANLPAVKISFEKAQDYCKFIHARLPTESEWIVAASVSQKDNKIFETKKNKFYFYPTKNYPISEKVRKYYHLKDNFIESMDLIEVNQTFPSFNGIYGLIGNVYEMTSSNYDNNKNLIIVKGGSFLEYDKKEFLKTTFIDVIKKDDLRYSHVGFRCVKDSE